MASTFTFTVTVVVNRTSGKFATRDEMAEAIEEMLESANYGDISGIGPDGDTECEISDWSVAQEGA